MIADEVGVAGELVPAAEVAGVEGDEPAAAEELAGVALTERGVVVEQRAAVQVAVSVEEQEEAASYWDDYAGQR